MIDAFLNEINSYDTITLFRHINPDGDALGSQLGLKSWLMDNFNNKKIVACGFHQPTESFFEEMDHVDDETIKNSLAIVLDTSVMNRIDDSRVKTAKKIVRIDHHIYTEQCGDVEWVRPDYAATCEFLATIFTSCDYILSNKTATYLYRGLLTDTMCFKTNNTTSHTLLMASKLAEKDLNLAKINAEMFDRNVDQFYFANKIRTLSTIDKKCSILVLKQEDFYPMSPSTARNYVVELGGLKEVEIWALFTEEKIDNNIIYSGSIRSKRIEINKIAEQFGGGGHKHACGIKGISEEQLIEMIELLKQIASSEE